MRRSSLIWIALGCVLAFGAIGCTDEGVGDPCTPETVPCDSNGMNCGYKSSEAYIEASSVQCKSRLCIVYKLDNKSQGTAGADPRKLCTDPNSENDPNCVDIESLNDSVYCTCRCAAGPGGNNKDLCSCPGGFRCEEVLALGGPGIVGSYCVKNSIAAGN